MWGDVGAFGPSSLFFCSDPGFKSLAWYPGCPTIALPAQGPLGHLTGGFGIGCGRDRLSSTSTVGSATTSALVLLVLELLLGKQQGEGSAGFLFS